MGYVIPAAVAFGLGVLFLLLLPLLRRSRAVRRTERLLAAGDWEQALATVQRLRPERQSAKWRERLQRLAAEGHQLAIDRLLKDGRFDDALAHAVEAATLLGQDPAEHRGRVIDAMLAEVRRLFAAGPAETDALLAMIGRTAVLAGLQPSEATFWQALHQARQGQMEQALLLMTRVHTEAGKQILDVPLYLGILLHRVGRPQEALRYLADANRIDSSCPLVAWQMGVSMVAAGGDSGLAVRALQRALGPRGLEGLRKQKDRFWVDALPEGASYIRRLATRHPFQCPLLGGDVDVLIRQGNLALAQAFYRQERFEEAAELYGRLLQDSPPTPLLLRGYGLALARTGQYDQAFKHLRIAHDQEAPKDAFTAAYLALCGALGKPINPDDKPRNITWAVQRLGRHPVLKNAEWAGIVLAVHAEARKFGVPLSAEEQLLLCDSLASVEACDAAAAEAYGQLAQTFPAAVKPVHAWLYVRAATAHGYTGPADLDLFARTFQEPAPAHAFFEAHGWDFNEVEFTYLARCASVAPGRFPEALGARYPVRGEAFLLARSQQLEQTGKQEPARESVEVLLALAPTSVVAHDNLARLHYRSGNLDRAVELLRGWQRLTPADHWPLVRQAIIEGQRGNAERRTEAITRALGLTRGPVRAAVAYLGARLALREGLLALNDPPHTNGAGSPLAASLRLLDESLREQPDHVEARWCLAAVHSVLDNRPALAAQAPLMDRPEVRDPRFHYLGAVAALAAERYEIVPTLAERAAVDPTLAADSRFVVAWARLRIGDVSGARNLLRQVIEQAAPASLPIARAVLGHLSFQAGDVEETIRVWSAIDAPMRKQLALDEPLRQTVYLAGLRALQAERYEQAADRFREAGKLGLREPRLGGLIQLALVKAGQRLLFAEAAGG